MKFAEYVVLPKNRPIYLYGAGGERYGSIFSQKECTYTITEVDRVDRLINVMRPEAYQKSAIRHALFIGDEVYCYECPVLVSYTDGTHWQQQIKYIVFFGKDIV